MFFSFCDSVASPQATVHCADEAGYIYSVLLLCRVFFPCCDSAAWPQATVWAPAWSLGTTIIYLRRKRNGAAGYGLGTTTKYL
jgi:hypothetical protein